MADTTITDLSRITNTTAGAILPISSGGTTSGIPVSAILTASGNMGSGYIQLPKGADLQSGVEGAVRFNTTSKKLEYYDGTKWSGSTTTYAIEYLVIAGGGGGGGAWSNTTNHSSGAGAGGYRASITGENSGGGCSAEPQAILTTGSTYSITVGGGGAGAGPGTSEIGYTGNNSKIEGTNVSVISLGGGFGAGGNTTGTNAYGGDGGSGGGANYAAGNCDASPRNSGYGTACQGYKGGCRPPSAGSAGGGGAGGPGFSSTNSSLRRGGDGVTSSITGAAIKRAGGGGPGAWDGGGPGTGTDGGGNGGGSYSSGGNGSTNTGGGGGGGGICYGNNTYSFVKGGDGGSGLVVLKIPLANYSGNFSGSPTVQDFPAVNPTHKVLIYTGGGTYTA